MADWGQVQRGLESGYQIGRSAGGKLSGLGIALGKIAESMKESRLAKEGMADKQNLLGYEGMIKGTLKPAQEGAEGAFKVPGIGNVVSESGMPLFEKDTSGNYVQKGIVPKGSKVISSSNNVTDPGNLSAEQQIQARNLAKKIYGVRGAQFGLPSVYEEMKSGKTIDEIEDSLRYSGQSGEFTGEMRNAAQSILMNTPETTSQKAMDYIDDLYSKGDEVGAKNQLKRLAKTQAGVELSNQVVGKERTIKLLTEIQGDLNNLESMGVNTNIFTGTAEQIAAKLGTVKSPEARKIATKINTAMQSYRRSMTGVAFSVPETKEYAVMFPSIGRTANFNTANIDALKEVFNGDLDNF